MLTITHKALDDYLEFERWVRIANKGEACLYHEGVLAFDRIQGVKALPINSVALSADQFAAQGYVHLVQRRLGVDRYEYIAVRSSKPCDPLSAPPPTEPAVAA